MIRVKRMRELLAKLPDNYSIYGYEGELTGIGVRNAAGDYVGFIEANDDPEEDSKVEGVLAPMITSEEVAKITDAKIDELLREIGTAAQSTAGGGIDIEMGQLPAAGPAREDMREAVRMWLRGNL